MNNLNPITINATVNATPEKVWQYWNLPEHVTQWNQATPDWHCPKASSDLRVGGKFSATMAAKDGSFSFDFEGTYTEVIPNQLLRYTMPDGRKVEVKFVGEGNATVITETFDPEKENPIEMQEAGWQMILNSFKSYAESKV
jgi:uncharacterized protein YndB with AHSA1/START domain